MTNLRTLIAALGLTLTAGFGACLAEDAQDDNRVVSSALTAGSIDDCTPLMAGQHIEAGTVCVSNDEDFLYITYDTIDDWELAEAHAWVGADLADMPQTNSGQPKIGNFPYNSGEISATSHTFAVPLDTLGDDLCDQTFHVAAHAAVIKPGAEGEEPVAAETAWGQGPGLLSDGGSWAMSFSFTVTCEPPPVEVVEPATCETAFAYNAELSTTFTDLMDTPRWGWSNGPMGPGSYSFDIYAGAGQNDLSNGAIVGTLTVEYDGATATVTYTMVDGYTLDETHLYIGSDALPTDGQGNPTVAPGQYGNIHDLDAATSDSFTIDGLSGDIFIVAHGVSCFN